MGDQGWRKSSYSQGGESNCVEVAESACTVGIRDSQHATLGQVTVSLDAWTAFLTSVKNEQL